MRAAIAFLLFIIIAPVCAVEWKSDVFHCGATLPDSPGWQGIETPSVQGISVVLAIQNLAKHALFGINVVENVPSANLGDPAVRQVLENLLRQFTYQFVGHSTVRVGGLDWLQYPVRSGAGPQQASGVVRFVSANGYIFGITLLRGGGQDGAQDAELQRAAASFRVLPIGPIPTATTIPSAIPIAPTSITPMPSSASTEIENKAPVATGTPDESDNGNRKLISLGVAGAVVVIVLFLIIRGSGATREKRTRQ